MKKGFTLIELLVVIAIVTLVIILPLSRALRSKDAPDLLKSSETDLRTYLKESCPNGVEEIVFDNSYGGTGFNRPIDKVRCK